MVADWLGSSDEPERFPFTERGDPSREAFVRKQAPNVLRTVGLVSPTLPGPLPDFAVQFDFPPRAAQEDIDHLPLPSDLGSVVLLESETGSGKTEAALRWASRLIDAGLVDGCFFAVPLRSAAVQLHGRVQRWLDRTYGERVAEALLAAFLAAGQASEAVMAATQMNFPLQVDGPEVVKETLERDRRVAMRYRQLLGRP